MELFYNLTMKKLLSVLLFLGLAMVTEAQELYKIYSTKQQKQVAIEDVVASLTQGQILIFGEQHDDSIGHVLEMRIFEQMHSRFNGDVLLTLEMFERDVQFIINEYLDDIISEKNFKKEARAWNNYKDYQPMVEFAKANKVPVIAANAPARYTNLVTRKGLQALLQLSKETKEKYIAPLPIDTLTGTYYEKFLEAMGGHSMPGMNLYQSQNFWDATMSYSINQAMKQYKSATVLQVNGRFHSDFFTGLGERLRNVYKKKVSTISCFGSDDFDNPNWKQYEGQADFIIITKPSTPK